MGGLPWGWIGIGAFTAVIIILTDRELSKRNIPFKLPVLGFAVGFYLPMATGVPIMLGALAGYFAEGDLPDEASEGVLFAGGLITGEALMGIVLAIPIAATSNTSILNIVDHPMWFNSIWILMGLTYLMYYVVKTSNEDPQKKSLLARNTGTGDRGSLANRGSLMGRSSILSTGDNYARSSDHDLPSNNEDL